MSLPPNLVRHLGKIMLQWSPLWLATTAVTTALGFAYIGFYKEDVWVASQAMIVRDEIGGTLNRQGRFDNRESLKAALDTILEIARNPQVVQQALQTQLPEDAEPPSESDINNFIGGQLSVRSPKGSEFGTTEIFYVDVRHNDKQQAVELNKAICLALEKRLQDIRISRYDGIERELQYALAIAKEQRTVATEQLKKIENDVGENLTDLRSLTDSPSAAGTAKLMLDQLTSERRQVEVQSRQVQEDLRFLQALENDPARVLVAPSNILNTQPGLKRLCEGLVDSQLQELQLSGRYTDSHPAVRAAKISRAAIGEQLGAELKLSRIALETEIHVSQQRLKLLDEQIRESQNRIAELADIRADYANILGEVRNRSVIIEQIEKDLAVAESNRRAAAQSSLVTRIDSPVLSDKPLGPGTKTILLAAVVAGFLSGIGLVLLFAPIDLGIKQGRRWSDHIYAANQAHARNTAPTVSSSPSFSQPVGESSASPLAVANSTTVPLEPSIYYQTPSADTTTTNSRPLSRGHSLANTVPDQNRRVPQGRVPQSPVAQSPVPQSPVPQSPVPQSPVAAASVNTSFNSANSMPERPSKLAMDIEPTADLIRAVQATHRGAGPIKIQSPIPKFDTAPVSTQGLMVEPEAASSKAIDRGNAQDAASAADRRTRPRQPPAAMFSSGGDKSVFGFAESSKMAT